LHGYYFVLNNEFIGFNSYWTFLESSLFFVYRFLIIIYDTVSIAFMSIMCFMFKSKCISGISWSTAECDGTFRYTLRKFFYSISRRGWVYSKYDRRLQILSADNFQQVRNSTHLVNHPIIQCLFVINVGPKTSAKTRCRFYFFFCSAAMNCLKVKLCYISDCSNALATSQYENNTIFTMKHYLYWLLTIAG
jgi:hypothetical protein